jgi:hypothetical protein
MENPYLPPQATVTDMLTGENNSGGGSLIVPPPGIKGWSWAAFILDWIWAIGNKTWIGLCCLVPVVGFFLAFYLGIKGRELAWRNKRWDSIEHFNAAQRKWTWWALAFFIAKFGMLVLIAIPQYQSYVIRAGG